MKSPRHILATLFPRKVYYAAVAVAGQIVRIQINAPDRRRALLEAEDISDGGYLLELTES